MAIRQIVECDTCPEVAPGGAYPPPRWKEIHIGEVGRANCVAVLCPTCLDAMAKFIDAAAAKRRTASKLPCCPHPVERHAYNGCADCRCPVLWSEHPDRDKDTSAEGIAALGRAALAYAEMSPWGEGTADNIRSLVDRILMAVCNCHDGRELWEHARREPDAFRAAVKFAMGVKS